MTPADTERKILQLDGDVQAIYSMLGALDGALRRQHSRLDEIAAELAQLDVKVDNVHDKLDAKIDRLDVKIDSIHDKLDAKIDQLDVKIDSIHDKLDPKIDRLDVKIDTVIALLGSAGSA